MSLPDTSHVQRVGLSYRADIQGLRGVAVLLVVAYHAGALLPGGFIGVDVFFVLSGFLITSLLLAEARATGTIRIGRFAARRIRRLLPALAVMLVGTVALSAAIVPVGRHLDAVTATGAAAATVRANLFLAGSGGYFTAAAALNPLLHTWSLSLEAQFYLLLPTLLMLALAVARYRGGTPNRAVLAAVGIIFGLSLTALVCARLTEPATMLTDGPRLFYSLHTRMWELAAGGLLALLPAVSFARLPTWWRPAGLLLLVFASVIIEGAMSFPGAMTALPVLGTLLALSPTGPSMGLTVRPLVWLGDRSYSWYLWHWPVLSLTRWMTDETVWTLLAAAALSLLPAMASYRFVEQPLRRRSADTTRRVARLTAVCVSLPLVVSLTAGALGDIAFRHASTKLPGLGFTQPSTQLTYLPDGIARGTIAIVGDSHAQVLVPQLGEQLTTLGFTVVNLTHPGCIFLPDLVAHLEGCEASIGDDLAALAADRPDLVVLTGRAAARMTRSADGFHILDPDGVRATSVAEALTMYEIGLTAAFGRLTSGATPVVFVSSVPTFDTMPAPTLVQGLRGEINLEVVPRAVAELRDAAPLAIERRSASTIGDVAVIDPLPLLCGPISCDQLRDGVLLYRDDNHLSQTGARRVTAAIVEAVLARLGD
jgi:peptidoglycan/LPS O-acetylase OafA/YrhL